MKWNDPNRGYFGKEAYQKYGDLVSKELKGQKISKRIVDCKLPGGLEYESEKLGMDNLYDLLECLEGMCYNQKAREIDDSTYLVF